MVYFHPVEYTDYFEEWVMTTCRDKIRPGIIPFFEIIRDIEPGKDVAVVRVTRGFDVHSLWHNNRNTYFIRVGTQSREPSPEELGRLFHQRGFFRAELRPVSSKTASCATSVKVLPDPWIKCVEICGFVIIEAVTYPVSY